MLWKGAQSRGLASTPPVVVVPSDVIFTAFRNSSVTLSVRSPETGRRGEGWDLVPECKCPWKLEASSHHSRASGQGSSHCPSVASRAAPQFLEVGNEGPTLCLSSPVMAASSPTEQRISRGGQNPPLVPWSTLCKSGIWISIQEGGKGGLKTNAGTLPGVAAGAVAETGAVDRRESTFSDPFVSLTLWVKFPCKH